MSIPPADTLFQYERMLWSRGYSMLAGMDEAGRGPLAGPVVSACVIFEPSVMIEGVYDSKALTSKKREELCELIKSKAVCYGVGSVDNDTIDKINILEATKLSMKRAVASLSQKPDYILIDAVKMDLGIKSEGIIKGDQKSFTIAAASIIAKVSRDRFMDAIHGEYPEYCWNENKGYGTESHREAIKKHGLSPYHRKSFTVK
jgi:ribonuclease HII